MTQPPNRPDTPRHPYVHADDEQPDERPVEKIKTTGEYL